MSNLSNNRISTQIEATEFKAIKDLIESLNDKLPFLIGLTRKERIELPKISRANKLFVEDAVQITQSHKMLFPPYVNVDEIKQDYTLFLQLNELLQKVDRLTEMIRDTRALAGSEAYSASLSCYKLLQIASKNGVPGTDTLVDQLSKRFVKASNSEGSSEDIVTDQVEQ